MKHVKGCAVELFSKTPNSILIHQVNCQGVMESGIAKKIKEWYPKHYKEYKNDVWKELGHFVNTAVDINGKFQCNRVAGVCGQYDYGRDAQKRYTNYTALISGIEGVLCFTHYDLQTLTLIIPKYIGCGLGGGDWNIVEQLLLDLEEMYDVEFTVVELD